MVQKGIVKIQEMILKAYEKIKISPESLPIVLVGCGNVIMPSQQSELVELIKPEKFGCANALGAAIVEVSGEVDGL